MTWGHLCLCSFCISANKFMGLTLPHRLCLPFLPSFCFLHRTKRSLVLSSSSTRPLSAQSFPPLSIALPALQTYSTPLSSVCVLIWPFWAWIPASAHSDRAQLVLPLKAERRYRHCVLSDRHLHNAYSPASLIFTVSEHSLYIFLCYIPHNDPILSRVSYLIGSAIPEEMWRIKKENENTVRVK